MQVHTFCLEICVCNEKKKIFNNLFHDFDYRGARNKKRKKIRKLEFQRKFEKRFNGITPDVPLPSGGQYY